MNAVSATILASATNWVCGAEIVGMGIAALSTLPTWLPGGKKTHNSFYIDTIPPQGIVLARPGRYYLLKDVAVKLLADNMSAVTIVGNDIHVDLCGFEIAHNVDKPYDACVGIAVARKLNGVKITNGTVRGFGLYGIVAVESSDLSLINVRVTGLRCKSTTMSSAGILLFGCTDSAVTHCSVSDARVNCVGYAGIFSKLCRNVFVDYCSVTDARNGYGIASGIAVLGSHDVHVRRCTIVGMSAGEAPGPAAHTCTGVLVSLSLNVTVTSCRAFSIHGSCDDAHGIAIFVCGSSVAVKNCDVKDVSSGFTPVGTGAKATGIEVIGAGPVLVHNCTVYHVRAVRPQDLQCAAFAAGTCRDVVFSSCTGSNVRCLSDAKAIGVGFGWGPDPRPMFVKPAVLTQYVDCLAEDCDVGFDLFMAVDPYLQRCSVKEAHKAVRDDPNDVRTLTCNACSECTPSLSTTVINANKTK